MPDAINHPPHYGGADNTYEAIKVIEAWALGFCLGNAVKYIARAEKKGAPIEDLKKARWYLDREIARREGTLQGASVAGTEAGGESGVVQAPGSQSGMAGDAPANGAGLARAESANEPRGIVKTPREACAEEYERGVPHDELMAKYKPRTIVAAMKLVERRRKKSQPEPGQEVVQHRHGDGQASGPSAVHSDPDSAPPMGTFSDPGADPMEIPEALRRGKGASADG